MRILVATALAIALGGCGSGSESSAQSKVDRCIERLLSRTEGAVNDQAHAYVRRMYCEPFESRGWVYADGALSIDAQTWLEEGGSEECEFEAGPVPCPEPRSIDCAMLHHVRMRQVRVHLAQLRADIECDDGTPVEQLGVP